MALARALAVEPKVLLLDEPFGALDAKVRKELRDWLRRLHDEVHVTTVFVTHDQEEALEVADEIVVINEGRIEQIGSPDELYDEPANDFVMRFLGPVTQLGDRAGPPARPRAARTAPAEPGDVTGTVTRITRVGFEMRLDVTGGRQAGDRDHDPQRVPGPGPGGRLDGGRPRRPRRLHGRHARESARRPLSTSGAAVGGCPQAAVRPPVRTLSTGAALRGRMPDAGSPCSRSSDPRP